MPASRQGAGCESVRVGPWGVFSGGGVVRAAARRGPTLPPPVPSGPTQLAASPECVAWVWAQAGPGAGATRRGWAPQVGPPAPEYTWHQACAPCPLPCTHLYPGGNGPGGHGGGSGGGVSCCPRSQHPPPGWALHSARLGALGGTRWAGGRGRNIPPRVPTGPGGRRQRLAPPRRPPLLP